MFTIVFRKESRLSSPVLRCYRFAVNYVVSNERHQNCSYGKTNLIVAYVYDVLMVNPRGSYLYLSTTQLKPQYNQTTTITN